MPDSKQRVYAFQFVRHTDGNFKGLWDLRELDPQGSVKRLIVDADALDNCLATIQGLFAEQGY